MKNSEKYKTAKERAEAFKKFCSILNPPFDLKGCEECELNKYTCCEFFWLDLEAEEEKPLPCPFCGSEQTLCFSDKRIFEHCKKKLKMYAVRCLNVRECFYRGPYRVSEHDAIAAHNRVAKVVVESESDSDAKGDK